MSFKKHKNLNLLLVVHDFKNYACSEHVLRICSNFCSACFASVCSELHAMICNEWLVYIVSMLVETCIRLVETYIII
jgi:hypothetical protein